MTEKYKVQFSPQNKSGFFSSGQTFLDAAQHLGIPLPALCGGSELCGKCKIEIIKGNILPNESDREWLHPEDIERGMRLACTHFITESCTVRALEEEVEAATEILTAGKSHAVELDPFVYKKFIKIPKPSMAENPSDLELLLDAAGLNANQIIVPGNFLSNLPQKLREADFCGTITFDENHIIDFEAGDTSKSLFGVAVDLGTTTVVCKLVDLISGKVLATNSRMNAQRFYGEDVISRISYSIDHEGGLLVLQKAIVDQLNEMLSEMVQEAAIDANSVYEMVVAGNTVMEHLLLGVSPHYLAELPYVPAFKKSFSVRASEMGININAQGNICTFPIIGRYVGGDTCSLLLTFSDNLKGSWLAVDIGTNGEMVLAHNGKLTSCSTAAGPAFEGAHISCGMRATSGAVSRVNVDQTGLHIQVIGESKPTGVCGSGLIDAIGSFRQLGLISETGRIVVGDEIGEETEEFARDLAKAQDNERYLILVENEDKKITLTQRDVREIQLAKGAIAAGIEILLKNAGLTAVDLDAVYLAGAFGQFIRRDMAVAIGLVPNVPLEKIHFIGNAACAGAELALVSKEERMKAEKMAESTEYIEISTDPDFQDIFAEKMMF
ncbi:MAG: DUF4445 domain-containing protein [Actinobacteria bacterium]|nr:DUF4445 domain-containing protein [Actinomycetota bacterium]